MDEIKFSSEAKLHRYMSRAGLKNVSDELQATAAEKE